MKRSNDIDRPIFMVLAVGPEARVSSEVLKLTIPFQVLQPEVKTERIFSQHSLSYPYIERNMEPNKVAELRPGGKRWVLIAPHGGYTPTEHVMAMRWDPDGLYTPDPASVPDEEGKELMPVMADVARWIGDRPYNETIVFGMHVSPLSILQEGIQSVPTMVHPYVFGLPAGIGTGSYGEYVDWGTLKPKERKAIRGSNSNFYFGEFLVEQPLNGHFTGDRQLQHALFAMGEAHVGLTGVRVPLRGSLEDTLRAPGFFEGWLKPFAATMNRAAEDLSRVFTTFDPAYVRARIEEAVLSRKEPDDEKIQEIIVDISRVPDLLDRGQRRQNIEELSDKGYPRGFIDRLHELNDKKLPDSGPATRWKRGFGYTFAIYQDQGTGLAMMAITTTIENGPAGVVEGVLGAKLVRPPKPFADEELEIKKASYRELVASLNGHVVHD